MPCLWWLRKVRLETLFSRPLSFSPSRVTVRVLSERSEPRDSLGCLPLPLGKETSSEGFLLPFL